MSSVRIRLGTLKQEVERLPVFCIRSDENRQVRNRRSRLATHQFLSKKFKTFQKKKNFHGFRHNYFLAGREAGRFAEKNMKIKELCMDERPREKMMAKGADSLSNAELMAILLRTGTGKMNVIDVAREALKSADNKLCGIASMPWEKLCRISGIGPSKAVTLAAAFEIGRRCAGESAVESRSAIASPRTVFRMMLPVLKDLDHEECWVLYLNRANFLISKEKVSSGGLDSTTLDSRTIVRKAIEKKASGIILVHNHPSGSAMPGTADINSTKQLDRILKTCEISLIDHVVIAENSFYSFADEELVQG